MMTFLAALGRVRPAAPELPEEKQIRSGLGLTPFGSELRTSASQVASSEL